MAMTLTIDKYHPVRRLYEMDLQPFIVLRFFPDRGYGFARAKQDGPWAHKDEECIFYLDGRYAVDYHPWSERPFFGLRHGEETASGRPFQLNMRRPHMIDIMVYEAERGRPRRKLSRWCDLVDYRKAQDALQQPPRRRVVEVNRDGDVVEVLWEGTDIIEMSELFPREQDDPITRYFTAINTGKWPAGRRIERFVHHTRFGHGDWVSSEGDVRAPTSVVGARRAYERSKI